MKHSIESVLILALGVTLGASAQTSPAPAAATPPAAVASSSVEGPTGPIKIALINFQMAMAKSNEGQAKFADLEKKYAPRSAELKTLNEEVENEMKELDTQGSKLSDQERATRSKAIEEKKKKFSRMAAEMRNDGNKDFQEMTNAIGPKLYQAVSDYAQKHGYAMILDTSDKQTSVVYSIAALDITKEIIEAYNAKSNVPPPPPAASDAPKPPAAH